MAKKLENKTEREKNMDKKGFVFFDRSPSIDPATGKFIPGKRGLLSALGRGMVGYSQGIQGVPIGPDPIQIENQRMQSIAQRNIRTPAQDFIEKGKLAEAAANLGMGPQQIEQLGGQQAFAQLIGNSQQIQPPSINRQQPMLQIAPGKITDTAINILKQPKIQPGINIKGRQIVPKGFDKFGQPTGYKIAEPSKLTEKQQLTGVKWNEEDVKRRIKFDVVNPKLQNFMEVGGRAYQELKDVAANLGIKLDFSKGGIQAWKTKLFKNAAMAAKAAPLMTALDNLRPELGTELMRQLGAFRSGEMASKFEKTLSQFSGDIREDIANMTTTIVKNKANAVLLDDNGKPLSDEKRSQKMNSFEANLIRKYNHMYRAMGLMDKPYTAKRSFKWLAENSSFNDRENQLIQNAMRDNKKFSRTQVIARLIEEGLL